MSSMSQQDPATRSQYIGDGFQGHRGQPSRSNPAHNSLLSDPLSTTPIYPFSSNIYRPVGQSGVIEPINSVNEGPGLSTGTSLAQHTYWGGGVQSVSQPEHTVFQFTASGTPAASLPEAPPMRYLHTDLPVLNVEQYEEGRYSKQPSKGNPKPNIPADHAENVPNPRKRGRKPAKHDHQREANEETKRTRGRPRLETKDQTPTERRRTQIRLAQRAYRNRKENAITDLQARIDGLKDVNNEINSAYQNLFDYASQRGLLAQAPEFGQQLQRLQSLVKQTQEEDIPRLSDQDSPEGNSDDNVRDTRETEDIAALNEEIVPITAPTTLPTTLPEGRPVNLWGGFQVSHEPVIQQEALASTSNLDPALMSSQLHQHQYEIVTTPTPDNASFGTNLSVDMNFANPAYTNWAQHPYNRLTGPRTMSFHEWAFARRLHRHAVERASALINMPNPPPTILSRVFGFVMLFETVDEIRARTTATLNRIRHQPLNYWEHPFHRLGGSGTHFSDQDGPSSLSGSSAYQSTGFATGPFNERTTRVRDTLLGVSQYINMSGWEGTWFDSGEVETYLAQNGIVIPTAADLHPVEVPPSAFSDVQEPQIQLMQTIPPNATHMPHENQSFASGVSDNSSPPTGVPTFSAAVNVPSTVGTPTTQGDAWPHVSVTSSLYGTSQLSDGSIPAFAGLDNMANVFPNTQSYIYPHHEPVAPIPPPAPKRVILDVNKFISDMISHATCLGRAPAFRPKDIANSFWGAVISD
ncbi:uncharacterized protein GGS22DRAFT_88620 [Annulohypoxylon maeteangense]|uniref:uncharacterized protein n=1 Tax=Annulohypoxylon maeteangense TaxID=1927788 RepID=UPI002007691D|nr:uncharacterized protein GGS22DRAFT_88620 [Annulohypoxylon maeteangense]KAI0887750.1 hypothetical protein GGS22DRAFT_88620 [Annulohypoxylon maeteangense]